MASSNNSNLFDPPTSEELEAAKVAREKLFSPPTPEEIAAAKQAQENQPYTSAGNQVLGAMVEGARKFDSVTGAPTRAAIGAAQNVGSMNPVDWAKAGGQAFGKQFAEDPDQAPTGEDIVKKAGVPEGIPSKTAGFAMDMAANPLNFAGPVMNAAGKTLNAAREIPYAGSALGAVMDFPGKVATKVTSKAISAPERAVSIYASDPSKVNSFIENTGGEISAGADEMKKSVLEGVQAKKNELNAQIKYALAQANPDSTVPIAPLIEELQKAKMAINKHTDPAAWQHIDRQIDTIKKVAGKTQDLNLNELYDVKTYLSDQRYGTLRQPNGDLFVVADDARKAAGKALTKATDILHQQAPGIRDADHVFSQLHDIDNKMSSSLLAGGKAEDMFASAGGATEKYANQHYTALKKIDDLVGTHAIEDAQTVYAARALNKTPSIRKEGFKTAATIGQGVGQSQIPARGYNAVQALGVPDDPIERRVQANRKLGSHGR